MSRHFALNPVDAAPRFTRCIDNTLYPRKALVAAREAYASYCNVKAMPRTDGLVDITVEIMPEYAADARQVVLEFWNYLLDIACEQHLELS